jgi:hypothetical protein
MARTLEVWAKLALAAGALCFAEMGLHQLKNFEAAMLSMDTRPFWTLETAKSAFQEMGTEGRQWYMDMYSGLHLGGDLAFPLFLSVALAGLMRFAGSPLWWSAPALYALADYAENFSVMNLLGSYPNMNADLAFYAGSVFTPAKWIGVVISIIAGWTAYLSSGGDKAEHTKKSK